MVENIAFSSLDAGKYGIEPALLLYYIGDCIASERIKNKNYHKGKFWMDYSLERFYTAFPWVPQGDMRVMIYRLSRCNLISIRVVNNDNAFLTLNNQGDYICQ